MKLNKESIVQNRKEWKALGYSLPEFDTEKMKEVTRKAPVWVHFGAGNIFRALHASMMQKLLNEGSAASGIVACEGYDAEILEKTSRPYDDLTLFVTLKADGTVDKTVIGSVATSLVLDPALQDFEELKRIFAAKSLQMATFTITEKGYALTGADGNYTAAVLHDAEHPAEPVSYIGKVAALLRYRFENGALPLAMVSTDNCSKNGDKLYNAISFFAKVWEEKGLVKPGFFAYVSDPAKVSFPHTMIDKITPRPDASVEAMLKADAIEGMEPVITEKHTYTAPFVNAEESEYLVIEDSFPNGRPPLEKAGVLFTDRETVGKVERMKVCTCLNPLHTALAVFGCLLGMKKISEEIADPLLKKLVQRIGYDEGLPVVTDPGIISPKAFIDTVVNKRLPNPFMPDTPQRIATDTSQKLAIRFGETIKLYVSSGRDLGSLKMIPLVFAGWLRYLLATDDDGTAFELSPDPLLPRLLPLVKDFRADGSVTAASAKPVLLPLLKDASVFGADLEELGLADTVLALFTELCEGRGAVRNTLEKYVNA